MNRLLMTAIILGGVGAFVLGGGPIAAQDHGGAGHGQVSIAERLMSADADENGTVTEQELVVSFEGMIPGHGGDAGGAAHHGNTGGGGNPHGALGGARNSAALALLLGAPEGTAISQLTQADLSARASMIVSHADANGDAALDATEVEAFATMMQSAGPHGAGGAGH
jgi:hypothetical protein